MTIEDLGLQASKKITDANRKWEARALINNLCDEQSATDQLVEAGINALPTIDTPKAYTLTRDDAVLRLEIA